MFSFDGGLLFIGRQLLLGAVELLHEELQLFDLVVIYQVLSMHDEVILALRQGGRGGHPGVTLEQGGRRGPEGGVFAEKLGEEDDQRVWYVAKLGRLGSAWVVLEERIHSLWSA